MTNVMIPIALLLQADLGVYQNFEAIMLRGTENLNIIALPAQGIRKQGSCLGPSGHQEAPELLVFFFIVIVF